MTVRVGLDLVFLGRQAGGVGRYARELVQALATRHPELELHAFLSRDAPEDLRLAPWASHVRWTTLPVRLAGPPWHLAASFAGVPALAVARRLHVLHGPANTVAVGVPGVASVVTMHDLTWLHVGTAWGPPEAIRAMRRVSVPTVRRADRVVADSAVAAGELTRDLGVRGERIRVVPLGTRPPDPGRVVTPGAELRRRFDLGAGPVLLCVAQKRPYKRQDVLVRALSALSEPGVRLVLPGAPTAFEAELRELAGRLGVADRVRFPDWVSDADLEGLYELATAVVLPSEQEGFGLPVLEAMARGVPVACADRSALPEVAAGAALLFDPDDQAAVDAAVARLLADPSLRAELAARGGARAAELTWGRTAAATAAVYAEAAASASLRR
jgi:glycosyltransferase involved in cell wall biosynthesis